MTTTVKARYDGTHIVPQDVKALQDYKAKLKLGTLLAMTFEPWDDRRTRLQQGLLHEILGRLGREQGMSLEAVKIQLKTDLGFYVPADKMLSGEVMPKWRGRFVDLADVYDGYPHSYIFLRSEAGYTRAMEAEFIDRAMLACDEAGVDIEDIRRTLAEGDND